MQFKGLQHRELDMATINAAKRQFDIHWATNCLEEFYPDLSFSCGYIGNIEQWDDDRNWQIWCNSIIYAGGMSDGHPVSVAVGRTGLLPSTPQGWTPVIRRMQQKLAALHVLPNLSL